MNSKHRIQLHLHCMWLRPQHWGFHAKGIAREVPLIVAASLAAVAAQWLAWHLN